MPDPDRIRPPFSPSSTECPLCGARTLRRRRVVAFDSPTSETLLIRACRHCNFAWQWPLARTAKESKSYFELQFAAGASGTYFDKSIKREIAALELDFVESLDAAKGRLLDVGSGDGTFSIVAFERGWSVVGIDPAGPTLELERDGRSCRLMRGQLADLADHGRFDIVTLWDVIEHVEAPLDLIEECMRWLTPTGWLIVETGNFGSTQRVERGARWWAFQLDHRWYFTPSVLRQLLLKAGLSEIRPCSHELRPDVSAITDYRGPSLLRYALKALRRPWATANLIAEYHDLASLAKFESSTAKLGIFALAARKALG